MHHFKEARNHQNHFDGFDGSSISQDSWDRAMFVVPLCSIPSSLDKRGEQC